MDEGVSLPQDIFDRVAEKKRKAHGMEIQSLEEMVSSGLDEHLAVRRATLERLTNARREQAHRTAAGTHRELEAFGEETLRRLEAELVKRRSDRVRDENRRRDERIRAEKAEEARKRQDEEAAGKKVAPTPDPSAQVRAILKRARSHMERGDVELAGKTVSEGLELDGFNAELLDLDAKIREAMAEDAFSSPAATPPPKKEKEKGKVKPQKSKPARAGSPDKVSPGAAKGASPAPGQRKFPSWAFSALAAVLIAAVAVIAYVEYMPGPADNTMTVAVLPWTPAGGERGLEVFTHALPDVVVRLLSAAPSPVGVLGYTTTTTLSSLGGDPAAPLIRLGYSHFLRGTLSRKDSLFTVHVELSDSGGAALWSGDYQRDTTGLILIPHEIAHGLRTFFRDDSRAGGTAVQVNNTDAYLLYLGGINAMREPEERGVDHAINTFSRSVGLDSTLAESRAGLSLALVARHAMSRPGAGNLLEEAGKEAAAAISLAPRSGDGYISMSRVLIERHRYAEALEMLDSAAIRSPGEVLLPHLRGLAFFRSGRPDQALALLQRAYRLDPRNVALLSLIATVNQLNKAFDKALWHRETAMFFTGDTLRYLAGPVSDVIILDPMLRLNQGQRVTSACLKLLSQDPNDYFVLYSIARILQVSGDIEESQKYFDRLETTLRAEIRLNPNAIRARMYLGLTLTRLGRYADGVALGEAAIAADPKDTEAKYLLARMYALQMYSPQTKTVDSVKAARAIDLLREAVNDRFSDAEICSADLYNIYYQTDIRKALGMEVSGNP